MKKGSRVSEETRKKMSEAHKGKPGPQHGAEVRERIAASRRGKVMSDETRAKISESLRARQEPSPMLGRKYSENHRQSLSEAQKARHAANAEAIQLSGEKFCPGCEVVKQVGDFALKSSSPTGIASWCKACTANAQKEWRRKNATRKFLPSDTSRICARCHEEKPVAEFGVQKSLRSGLAAQCKTCISRRQVELKYGLERGGLDLLIRKEGGGCAVCGHQDDLAVDHCHNSMQVRGILCRPCNTAAGMTGDDPERLLALASYLEERKNVDMRNFLQPDVT